MKKLSILLLTLIMFTTSNAQQQKPQSINGDIMWAKNLNEVLGLTESTTIIDFSIGIVIGPNFYAFPYKSGTDAQILDWIKQTLARKGDCKVAFHVADLVYKQGGEITSVSGYSSEFKYYGSMVSR